MLRQIYYQYPETLKNGLNQTWESFGSDVGEERAIVAMALATHIPRNNLFYTSMTMDNGIHL